MNKTKAYAEVTELNGIPRFIQALPLAVQHVVAMIVGCVTPAIILAGVTGVDPIRASHIGNRHIAPAVSIRAVLRFRPSGYHGSQLCLHTAADLPGKQI